MYFWNESYFYKQNKENAISTLGYIQYSVKSGFKSIGQMSSTNKPIERDSHNKHTTQVC